MDWKLRKNIKGKIVDIALHPAVEQVILQRGIKNREELEKFLAPDYEQHLHDPMLFQDMQKVVSRVKKAITSKETVGVFGDHDADGISGATVLVEGLENLGIAVEVYIPDKISEGHGLNINAVDLFMQKGVSLIFTVDCGTSNVEEVSYAVKNGIDVVITDHHHAPEVLPEALAIINPQIPTDTYPFRELSGTAVAFKVVQALYEQLAPDDIEQIKWLLDVVSVGTIADCMPLIDENRVLVKYGLFVLSKTRRIGYKELFLAGNISVDEYNQPSAYTVAFQIAPRINAAGRMSHAKHAYALMREESKDEARKKARVIEKQNNDRRRLVDRITRQVEKIIEKDAQDRGFIVVSSEDYPVGIIGIVAGRIAEKYKKPTGIFSQRDGEARGSFRSIDGVHIMDVLDHCAAHLTRYGGHEKAAGAILQTKDLGSFSDAADHYVKQITDLRIGTLTRYADATISLGDVDHDVLDLVKKLAPFGEKNEEPIFWITDVIIDSVRMVGNGDKHMKFVFTTHERNKRVDAIGFGLGARFAHLSSGDYLEVLGCVQENVWMGNISLQINVLDILPQK